MTLQVLGFRLTELGRAIDVSTLAKIEKGQRRIDVDDLIALALALDVSPNRLLLPDVVADGSPVELTSSYRTSMDNAWSWLVRDRPVESRALPKNAGSVNTEFHRSNFYFLRLEWPDIYAAAAAAERFARINPTTSCVHARLALELAISWVYTVDGSLGAPEHTNLAQMISEPFLAEALGVSVISKMNAIRRQGNLAAHSHGQLDPSDSIGVVEDLYVAVLGIIRTYSPHSEELPSSEQSFNTDSIPWSLAGVREIYGISESGWDTAIDSDIDVATTKVRPQDRIKYIEFLQARGRLNRNARGGDEESLAMYIDLLLEGAGWSSSDSVTRNYRVPGSDSSSNSVMVMDIVLRDDDSSPLAIVETKRAEVDPSRGAEQARRYASWIEEEWGRLPIIFLSNGARTLIWDDIQQAPREVSGLYTKDELRKAVRSRISRNSLADTPMDNKLVSRPYQQRIIRRVCESFEDDHRRGALLSMATGTGKTRVMIGVVDLLVRARWVNRALVLVDSTLLIEQVAHAFGAELPNLLTVTQLREGRMDGQVYIATYQTMLARFKQTDEFGQLLFGAGYFDLIIIDEASVASIAYQSIVEYFDALTVAFTSTPKGALDRSIYQILDLENGVPTAEFTLSAAVEQGYSVPPTVIEVPKMMDYLDQADAGKIDRFAFNADIVDAMLKTLMEFGIHVGVDIGKTIIFSDSIRHVQFIVERFRKLYPEYDPGFLQPITSRHVGVRDMISRFADPGSYPRIVVSSGMLDTGIRIPSVVNLALCKPMRGSALWQVLARGSQAAPNLFGPGKDKRTYHVFDYCGSLEFARTWDPETWGFSVVRAADVTEAT